MIELKPQLLQAADPARGQECQVPQQLHQT